MSIKRVTAHEKDVGGIPVARALPSRGQQRTVGAWCFLDHIGPAEMTGDISDGLQVGLHPHTNLQTFTWMLKGELLHRDSLGHDQVISAGQVNLMTAGTGNKRGICHTEQSVKEGGETLHAIQLWIALPMDEEIEASFYNYPDLPHWTEDNLEVTVTTGTFKGHTAPTMQYSKLLAVHFNALEDTKVSLDMSSEDHKNFEYGLLVVEGSVNFAGETYNADELIVLQDCDTQDEEATLSLKKGTQVMMLGGEPLPHKTLLWWNFVDRDLASIEQSIKDWNNRDPRFGDIDISDTPLRRLEAPAVPEGFKE